MNTKSTDLPPAQASLITCLERQEQLYGSATAVILKLRQSTTESRPEGLAELQQQLGRIRTAGGDVHRSWEAVRAESQPGSQALTDALASQKARLQSFLEQINELQSDFRMMRDRLQPQLDSDATRRSMQQAYQKSMQTG